MLVKVKGEFLHCRQYLPELPAYLRSGIDLPVERFATDLQVEGSVSLSFLVVAYRYRDGVWIEVDIRNRESERRCRINKPR
jgi:hypothetical protein